MPARPSPETWPCFPFHPKEARERVRTGCPISVDGGGGLLQTTVQPATPGCEVAGFEDALVRGYYSTVLGTSYTYVPPPQDLDSPGRSHGRSLDRPPPLPHSRKAPAAPSQVRGSSLY